MKIPYCQDCSYGELEIDDVIDLTGGGDCTEIEELTVGHCPYCGKVYQWKSVYHYTGFVDLCATGDTVEEED